jgi:hypothetical protein
MAQQSWTAQQTHAVATRHAELEARGDLEGTMATLIETPRYEFHPLGLRMTTTEQVRRYYEHLLGHFVPMTRGYELLEEWVNETSLAQEYSITLGTPEGEETHRVIGVLFVDEASKATGGLLGGERIFASERCTRLMVGDEFVDELMAS